MSDVFQDLNRLFSLAISTRCFLKLPVVNFNFLGFTVKGKKRKDDFRVLIHYIILYYYIILVYYIILYYIILYYIILYYIIFIILV